MRPMSWKSWLLLLLTLSSSVSPGQTAALIGLRHDAFSSDDGKGNPIRYSTLLITVRDGRATLAANLPALVVPRKDGFWRVGYLPGDYGSDGLPYAIPALSGPPAPPKTNGTGHRDDSEDDCSSSSGAVIDFVDPEIISIVDVSESTCGTHPTHTLDHATYRLDDLKKPLDITTVLGDSAKAALLKSFPAAQSENDECPPVDDPDTTEWGIKWSPGNWILLSKVTRSQACGGDNDYEVDFTVPSPVLGGRFGRHALSPLRDSVLAQKLAAEKFDFALSPAHDVLVFFGNPIRVFRFEDQRLSASSLLSVSDRSSSLPVMVQWATGKYVTEWERKLKEIGAKQAKEQNAAQPGHP
jgi:hypothetical protein